MHQRRFAICILVVSVASCMRRDPDGIARGTASAGHIEQTALHRRHGAMSCTACHEQVGGHYLRAQSWTCQGCHAKAPLGVHAAAPADSRARECWSCHDFVGTSDKPLACASCHAKGQGALRPIAPHDPAQPDEDCAACHRAHQQPALAPAACESCHRERVTGHDQPGIPITGCASCHGYHEPAAVAAERCAGCHKQSRARVPATATFAGGHVTCDRCHREHKFVRTEVLGCREQCHATQVALAEGKVAAHRCVGCHDQHDVRASARRSCEGCHAQKIQLEHPKDLATKTACLGCHKPHAGRGAPLAVACSRCHHAAASDRAFHQGAHHAGPECRDCHKPHGFDLSARGVALCATCHGDTPFPNAKRITPLPEHENCLQCHGDKVQHEPAGPRVACASCHEREAAIAKQGHTNCTSCHEPHRGTQKQPCANCHATEAATAPVQHQVCTSCHDQHSTAVKRRCAECHQDRTTGVHAGVAGGCQTCHRPHGPSGPERPPACTTCHQNLQLMHQVPGHKDCAGCHRSHGEQPYKRRAACIACHKAQHDHQPEAVMCIGCHVFGGAR